MSDPKYTPILITSGPTRAPLDAIRFLTNRSTGEMGSLLAQEAEMRGGSVTLIYGKGSRLPSFSAPERHRIFEASTFKELAAVLERELKRRVCRAALHAMAVLDFIPERAVHGKVSSVQPFWDIRLIRTPKVIRLFKELDPGIFLVGFKLEVGVPEKELHERTLTALKEYKADMMVANEFVGGERGRYSASIIDRDGSLVWKGEGKEVLARELMRIVWERLHLGREKGD